MANNVAHNVAHNVVHENREETKIKLVKENSRVTRAEIALKLGVSEKTVERIIKTMDYLVYVGSGNNGYWEIL